VQPGAGLQRIGQQQPERERNERSTDEPAHRTQANAAHILPAVHARKPRNERDEHKRCDDHLDEPQEDIGDDREVARDGFQRGRIGGGVARVARGHAQQHADADIQCEAIFHVRPSVARSMTRWQHGGAMLAKKPDATP